MSRRLRIPFLFCITAMLCPAAAIQWGGNGHFYEAIDTPMSWADAQAAAIARGGYLATITSQQEQDFLFANFGGARRFIGLSDIAIEGTFAWVTGETLSYTNWDTGEPNDFNNLGEGIGEDVAEMRASGLWNDVPATLRGAPFQLASIFEFNSQPLDTAAVPEPGTFSLGILALLLTTGYRRR